MIRKIKSFLFENKTDKQTIMKNTFWLMLAEGISKGWMFLITILIARILWPEQFWILSFVMSFVAMFIVITDFWLTTLMIRELSRDHSKIQDYLVNLSFLKVALWILTFILVWTVSQFIWKDSFYITLILIYCWYAIINNFWEFIRAFFRPSEKMQHEALLKIINGILMLVIVIWVLFYYWDLESILYGYLVAWILSFILSLIYVIKRHQFKNLKLNKIFIKDSFKKSWIIWLSLFFISIYISTDQIFLWLYDQIKELWTYWLAYRFVLIYGFLTGIFFISVFPKINKSNYLKNKNNYKKWLLKIIKYNSIFFILFEIAIFILFKYIGIFEEYKDIYLVLSLLSIYVLFEPIGQWTYINIISIKKDIINIIFLAITSIINIIWNIILIPSLSYYWAILTTILSYIIYFILSHIYLLKNYR